MQSRGIRILAARRRLPLHVDDGVLKLFDRFPCRHRTPDVVAGMDRLMSARWLEGCVLADRGALKWEQRYLTQRGLQLERDAQRQANEEVNAQLSVAPTRHPRPCRSERDTMLLRLEVLGDEPTTPRPAPLTQREMMRRRMAAEFHAERNSTGVYR